MEIRPEPPPEGKLIADAAERLGLSIREAARRAGISYGRWRQIVTGYQNVSPGSYAPVRAPARTLARMAQAVGVSPEQIRTEGQRPDAAEILKEILRQQRPPLADGPPSRPEPPPASALNDVDEDELRPYLRDVLAEIAAAVTRHGPSPSGEQVFGNAQEIEIWDNSPWPRGERARAIAVLRMITDEALRPGERRAMLLRTTAQYVTKRLQRVISLALPLVPPLTW